jgi:hypothetical protein
MERDRAQAAKHETPRSTKNIQAQESELVPLSLDNGHQCKQQQHFWEWKHAERRPAKCQGYRAGSLQVKGEPQRKRNRNSDRSTHDE